MAVLSLNPISLAGTPPTFVAASGGGDTFVNTGGTYLHVKNGGGASITVTISGTTQCDQGFSHDDVVTVTAAGEARIGPFPIKRFGRTGNITYSAVTSVTVALVGLST